jgi:hypothetical protein
MLKFYTKKSIFFPIGRTDKNMYRNSLAVVYQCFFSGKNLSFLDKEIGKILEFFSFSSANWNNFDKFLFG